MHLNPFMLLGGSLRGTLPNPSLVTDEASLVISAQVFGRRAISEAIASTTSASTTSMDEVRAFLQHPTLIPKVRAGAGIAITEDAMGPTIAAVPESMIDGVRAFVPHPQAVPKVRAGTGITITEDAQGPTISASGASPESMIDGVRAFIPHDSVPRPGGPQFAVQINYGGAFYGDDAFTYTPSAVAPTVTLGKSTSILSVLTTPAGIDFTITPGATTVGLGADLNLSGGSSVIRGGTASLRGGPGDPGGSVSVEGGNSTGDQGGDVSVSGGQGNGVNRGGHLALYSGEGGFSGVDGNVVLGTGGITGSGTDRITLDGSLPTGDGGIEFNDYPAGHLEVDSTGHVFSKPVETVVDVVRTFMPHFDLLVDYSNRVFGGNVTFKGSIISGAPRTGTVTFEAVPLSAGVGARAGRVLFFTPGDDADRRTFALVHGFDVFSIQAQDDAGANTRNILQIAQLNGVGLGVTAMNYANSTDLPLHTFHGALSEAYAPGSFSILTERFAHRVKRLQLTGAQRASLAGTARLRVSN